MKRKRFILRLAAVLLALAAAFFSGDAGAKAFAMPGRPSAAAIQASEEERNRVLQQIRDIYAYAKKKSGRSSFDGYCATYVNWQLVGLGINTSYISGNGKDEFDNYKNKSVSSGGYRISAYPAGQYSLRSALNAITGGTSRDAYNILLGFEKTQSAAGSVYGHTCFIHAILDGYVYYSENFSITIGGRSYPEGTPIVCSLGTFCEYYGSDWFTLDGVIHFRSRSRVTLHPCGGDCETTVVTASEDGTVGELPEATLEGYSFAGWYTKAVGGEEFRGGMTVTADITLYAHWTRGERTPLTYVLDGGVIQEPAESFPLSGFDLARRDGTLIVYQTTKAPKTNADGAELAVNAEGLVVRYRPYGSVEQMEVPEGGFVLSGQGQEEGSAGAFVTLLYETGCEYIGIDHENGVVTGYPDRASYLAATKWLQIGELYGELPVPAREDSWCAGWSCEGSPVTAETEYTGTELTALWTPVDGIEADAQIRSGNHLYERLDISMTWEQARAFCEQRGGHLVTITDEEEQQFVEALLEDCPKGYYYIGFFCGEDQSEWQWVTDEAVLYDNWDPQSPEPTKGFRENRAAVIGQEHLPYKQVGEWAAVASDRSGTAGFYAPDNAGFLCETELAAPETYEVEVIDYTGGLAEISLRSGELYAGEVYFMVCCEQVCTVVLAGDDGYELLLCEPAENGGVFTITVERPCTVAAALSGDVDLDGTVSAKDATLLRRLAAQVSGAEDALADRLLALLLADVNRNGTVSVRDVTRLRMHVAGVEGFLLSWDGLPQ